MPKQRTTQNRGADGDDHAHPGRRVVRMAATVVWEVSGLSVSPTALSTT